MEQLEDRLAPATIAALASFDPYPNGANPYGVIRDAGGDLFGTTNTGGAYGYGTIFEVKAGSGLITTLASFNYSTTGAAPESNLVEDAGGNLFGTTYYGGANGDGTAFELVNQSGSYTLKNLASFNGTNGLNPNGTIALDASDDLFGATNSGGGTNQYGTVFEVKAGSNTIQDLATFDGYTKGENPNGVVMDSHGNLYGTAPTGGNNGNGYGTVFELPYTAGAYGALSVLAYFQGNSTTNGGYFPNAVALDSHGNLYGTTLGGSGGGTYANGSAFEVPAGTSTIETLYKFPGGNEGVTPTGAILVDGSGNIYGSTTAGAGTSNSGAFYKLTKSGGSTYSVGYSHAYANPNDGTTQRGHAYFPYGAPVKDGSGDVFYTANNAAPNTAGAVFELKYSGGSYTPSTVASFSSNTDGALPNNLVRDSKGDLFGVTSGGGVYGYGTVFEVQAGTNTLQTLYSFHGTTDGAQPNSLIVDGSGDLFGTALAVGGGLDGTVFELKYSAGSYQFQVLHAFNFGTSGEGNHPGSLFADAAGNLFGVTVAGGLYGYGTVFEETYASGSYAFKTLYSFGSGGGVYPANLIEDAGGHFWGTTIGQPTSGGTYGVTIFELTNSGSGYTERDAFTFASGVLPNGPLVLASNGDLFGTTYYGGTSGHGSVFQLATNGSVYSYSFTGGSDGGSPAGGVFMDSAGDLFGTTSAGGANGDGTLFEFLSGASTPTTVASFSSLTGAAPSGDLAEDSQGNFYTVTGAGGAYGEGTVSEINDAVMIASLALPTGTVSNVYNQTTAFSAGGGSGWGYTFTAPGLPAGLTFNTTTDIITGTPTQSGTFNVNITAKDSAGHTGTKTFTLTIDPALTVSPASLPVATVANAYSPVTLTPSGGSGSGYSVTYVSGLPSGLTFNSSTDIISGTPASGSNGSYTVKFNITDSIGATGTVSYPLTVDTTPGATPTTLPYAAQGGAFSANLSGTGGSGSGYSFKIVGTNPVPGINLSSSGQFSGSTSVATGSYAFTVQVTDGIGAVGSQSFTINVEKQITISPALLTAGTLTNTYNQTTAFSAGGGSGSFNPLVESGTVPGLTFNSATDKFTGTPTQSGTFPFTVSVTDSLGGTGSQGFNLTVDPAVTLTPATLPMAVVNTTYSVTLTGGGGSGIGYVYTGSGLPGWLSISGNTLTGNPNITGSPFSFTITATDSAGGTTTNNYTLKVDPALALSPSSLPATAEYDSYYVPMSASGGSGSGYLFSATELPAGLSFSGNVLNGEAKSSPGAYNFTITVTDSAGGSLSEPYSITVTAPISLSPVTLPVGTLGNVYTQTTLSASGGSGTGYIFSESGSLPSGITFNAATAVFSGTPSQYGTFSIQISVSDSKGGVLTQPYSLLINFSLGSSANAKFVDAVYQQLLHRAPDPGAVYWLNLLNSGTAPSTLIGAIEQSTEYLTEVVAAIYQHYLGRAPDPGSAYWVNQLAGGLSIESVTATILSSQEYFNDKQDSYSGFVNGLYNDVLGRSADSGGLSFWVGYLNAGGSRYQAALAFLTSTEYRSDLVGGGGIWNGTYPVFPWNGYYLQFLGRSADAGGLAYWVQELQSGLSDQQVLAAIFGSTEAYDHWS